VVVTRVYAPLLERAGLTYPQYLTMLTLWQDTGRPRSVGELGGRLHLDSGTLTPLLKRLVSMGYVTRSRDAGDERRVLVAVHSHLVPVPGDRGHATIAPGPARMKTAPGQAGQPETIALAWLRPGTRHVAHWQLRKPGLLMHRDAGGATGPSARSPGPPRTRALRPG
jgi:hypothetical protein